MKHYLLILTAALVAFNASAQKTEKLTASKGNDYGLVYTLPKTAVDITVETETTGSLTTRACASASMTQ